MRSATAPKVKKSITKRDEGTIEKDERNFQTKKAGYLSNSRVPLTPSNRNAANSADFCLNVVSSSSTTTQSTVPRSATDSCSTTLNSKSCLRRNVRRPIYPENTKCEINQDRSVTTPPSILDTQEGDGARDSPQSGDNTMTSSGRDLQSFIAEQKNTLTLRQRNLRKFIAEQRSKQVKEAEEKADMKEKPAEEYQTKKSASVAEEYQIKQSAPVPDVEETYMEQKGGEGYETIQSATDPCRMDNSALPGIQNKPSTKLMILTSKAHENGESSHPQCNSLVGTDICVPLPHDTDASMGQLSENDEISSTTSADKNSHAQRMGTMPVIYLGRFQQSLWLDFGDERLNTVGRARSLSFLLQAPQSPLQSFSSSSTASSSVYVGNNCYIVEVEKIPVKKGFTLNFLDQRKDEKEDKCGFTTTFSVDGGKSRSMSLAWQPTEPGNMREVLYLKLEMGRIRIIAYGKAGDVKKTNTLKARTEEKNDKQTQKQEPPIAIREHLSKTLKKNKNYSLGFDSCVKKNDSPNNSMKTTMLSTKTIKSSSQTVLNNTRLMCNDAWADKQCITYQGWLNFLYQHRDGMPETDSMLELDTIQPNERQTLKTLLLQRQGAHTRQMAITFYRGQEMLAIRSAIELDVDNKRLSFRTDPYVLANVNLRSRLISLLFSYSIPWLRLGLETIFGETITVNSLSKSFPKSDMQGLSVIKRGGSKKTAIKALVKRFITERVLSDPRVKKKYTRGKCMMPSGRFEVMYKKEMGKIVLKRILLLVVFLDHAKTQEIIHPSPPLFIKVGTARSSKDFLALLCKDYVHGIGNLSKHLGHIGISVSYTQSHIEELDFSITNMAVDLRDGTRLAKLAEILSGDTKSSILAKLRLPAVSRLQKMHNIRVVLSAFSALSIPNIKFVQPDHFVDGHRPQVLQFLWSIISHFNLSTLLDTSKLKLEIDAVHRTNRHRSRQQQKSRPYDLTNGMQEGEEEQSNELCTLLLQWSRAVCWSYDVEVKDFSKSFSDGKAICYLVHFYHPSILRRDEILATASDMFQCGMNVESMKKDPQLHQRYQHALENERHNSELANRKMKEIGGIPHVLSISDSTALPDERATIISIAYLCSRLLESNKEILSTIIIQRAFRKHRSTELSEQMRRAVVLISLFWSRYKSAQLEQRASTTIQKWLRRHVAITAFHEKLTKHQSARRIQVVYRYWKSNGYNRFINNQVIMIQKVWRGQICQRQYQLAQQYKGAQLKKMAVMTLQKWSHRLCAIKRYEKLKKHGAASKIQAVYRAWRMKDYIRSIITRVIIIQKISRSFLCRFQYRIYMRSAILIQKTVRRELATSAASNRKDVIIRIQCVARRYLAVRKLNLVQTKIGYMRRLDAAVTICQAYARRTIAMKHFHEELVRAQAAIAVQKAYRYYIYRSHNLRTNEGAKLIQASYRGHKTRILTSQMIESAVVIQNRWRCFSAQLFYKVRVSNMICVQSLVRGHIVRSEVEEIKIAISTLQKTFRRILSLRAYNVNLFKYKSSRKIQSAYRSYRLSSSFTHTREGVTIFQAICRGILARDRFKSMLYSVVLIQNKWRSFSAQLHYKIQLLDRIITLSLTRTKLAAIREAAITKIQCACRKWISARIAHALKEIFNQETMAREGTTVCQDKLKNNAASIIQRNWRCYVLLLNYMSTVRAVKVVQNFVRYWMTARANHDRVLRIQHTAAGVIQLQWRGYATNVDYMISIFAIITVQSFVRRKKARQDYLFTVKSIVLLQNQIRRSIARKYFKEKIDSVSSMPHCWKAAVLSKKQLLAVTEIQRFARGKLVRADFQVQHVSACYIQKFWRCYHSNTNFMLLILSMIKVQSLWRQVLAKKKRFALQNQRAIYETTLSLQSSANSVPLQKSGFPVPPKHSSLRMIVDIQKRWKGRSARRTFLQVCKGFISLQSLFRGQCVRRLSSRKMSVVAKRCALANVVAEAHPQMTLGLRTSDALLILRRSQRLAEIIKAIRTLETSTGLSHKCCIAFTDAGAHKILYKLIRSCNRSLPHVELLQFILMTLTNVSNHPGLISSIATRESIDILLDLIQMFRDKDSIFCLASSLLELLALSEDKFTSQCMKRENMKRISGVHSLCLKKLSLIRGKSAEIKRSGRTKPRIAISKEMSTGIRALQHILQKLSTHEKLVA